jgi:hypothetical protein
MIESEVGGAPARSCRLPRPAERPTLEQVPLDEDHRQEEEREDERGVLGLRCLGLLDHDLQLGYALQSYISSVYFRRYIESITKLQAVVHSLPLAPSQEHPRRAV